MEFLDTWYKREVYSWRTGAAIGWTLLSQPAVVVVYLAFSHIHILHPVQWISGWLSALFSSHYVMLMMLLTITLGGLCILTSSSYTVTPEISQTRLHSLVHMFSLSRLIQCGAYMFVGGITAWVCSTFLGDRYANLTLHVGGDSGNEIYQLNEYHMFLVVYGMYTGVAYHISMYIHQNNYIQFPVLQQAKFFQMRGRLYNELLKSVSYSLWQTLYFYPLYWLFGHIPKDFVLYHISLKCSSQPLNSLWGMLDPCLFYQILLCGIYIHFTWTIGSNLYKIYQTEHFAFPVESAFEDQRNKCLHDSLNFKTHPLIQYLGFSDLCHLSKNSLERRHLIFSLSQPGGHPHNWNRICTTCLAEIDALNQRVQESNWKVFASAPIRQASGEKAILSNTSMAGDATATTLSFRGSTTGNGSSTSTQPEKPPASNTQTFKDLTLHYLKKKPIFSYFLNELPDSKSRQLFASSQIQIWAVESLSNLATASYTEDKFGVVQRSLPDIITSVLNLQENVDKHFKLATTVNRRGQKDPGTYDVQLGYLLQTSLKSCIYKIVNTFGKHVLSLHLSADTVRKLKQFMEYKE